MIVVDGADISCLQHLMSLQQRPILPRWRYRLLLFMYDCIQADCLLALKQHTIVELLRF